MKSAPDLLDLHAIALFLDFDGTLAMLQERPDDVLPDSRRTLLLQQLHTRLHGRLAIVSGRSISVLDFLTEAAVPSLAGVHGLQRRNALGDCDDVAPLPALVESFASIKALKKQWPELIMEYKGASMAVHFRQAPEAEEAVVDHIQQLADQHQLAIQHGRSVVELRNPGRDKGDVISLFMQEPPFRGYRPVFVGDDLTDEAGFRVVNKMDGISVKVGNNTSSARYLLPDVEAVLTWLEESCHDSK